jgi:two-component system NtrC family response regulator
MSNSAASGRDSFMKTKKNKESNLPLYVLVVDDDEQTFRTLKDADLDSNIHTSHAVTLLDAQDSNKTCDYDIILLKDRLPDGSAVEAISSMLHVASSPELLVFSRKGDAHEAELILNSGCWDYIVEPNLPQGIVKHLKRVIHYRRDKSAKTLERQQFLQRELRSEGIVGSSRLLQHCLNLMVKAAQSDANVLISGESGTGKELFATSIHAVSSRANREFVVVDCASLTPTLVESILFGHIKGSFTGADRNKTGLIKKADGGTLFLDEVGEIPLEMQKKFLRVLQEQSFMPVGSNIEVKSNFRLIAATNKNLQELCKKGEFREDLLFRIQTFHLELPPLRKRTEDITLLAYDYRDHYCRSNKVDKNFSTAYLMLLKEYDWPGNVRELYHALEYSFVTAQDSDTLYPLHLPPDIRINVAQKSLETKGETPGAYADSSSSVDLSQDMQTYRERAIAAAEKNYLRQLVNLSGGDLQHCLQVSGLSRSRFYALLKKYDISLQGF